MQSEPEIHMELWQAESRRRTHIFRVVLALIRKKPLGAIGGLLVFSLIIVALLGPTISPYDPIGIQRGRQFLPPDANHWLGTDNLGRDQLSRLLFGARISLYVGIGAALAGTSTGALLGLASAYAGGIFDSIVQRLVDAVLAFPVLILALVIAATLGSSVNNVLLAIAIVLLPQATRVIRSSALSIKEMQYIEAARAIGVSPCGIVLRHLLPQTIAPYLIVASAAIGSAIIVEASISFVGAGAPPPTPTWGNMLSGAARQYAERAPWLVVFPGLALTSAVFGFNLLGDALRDVVDPRMRGN